MTTGTACRTYSSFRQCKLSLLHDVQSHGVGTSHFFAFYGSSSAQCNLHELCNDAHVQPSVSDCPFRFVLMNNQQSIGYTHLLSDFCF